MSMHIDLHISIGSTTTPRPQHSGPALSHAEAQRVQRYQERLAKALAARDQRRLRETKRSILQAAYAPIKAGTSPALRTALRQLTWQMAAMLLTRDRSR